MYKLLRNRSNIHAHYDLSNELFKTFLDKDLMMYSCGIFETELVESPAGRTLAFSGSLEDAQRR